MRYLISILCCLIISASGLKAQTINPPSILCASINPSDGDITVNWNLPNVNCGPFQSYYIYASQNGPGGPFTLLDSVTNQGQTSYLHVGANGTISTWCYYMVSNFNCPGQTPVNSDTACSLDPPEPIINYVTVQNGQILMNWEPVDVTGIAGYVIHLVDTVNGNFIPIDTVFGANADTYIDLLSDPALGSYSYTLFAFDSCGNRGLFNEDPHNSIFLRRLPLSCALGNQELTIRWNAYVNWPSVVRYRIYAGVNGAPLTQVDSVSSSTLSYDYSGFVDGDSVCLMVQAVHPNGSFLSNSNMICFTVDIVQPVRYSYITNITVIAPAQVQVTYRTDTLAVLAIHEMQRSDDGGALFNVINNWPIPVNLSSTEVFVDANANTSAQRHFYRLFSRDSCDIEVYSTEGASILLTASSNVDNVNNLSWTPFELEGAQALNYYVYRENNGVFQVIDTLGPTTTQYSDLVSVALSPEGDFCYRIDVRYELTAPNGLTNFDFSQSNIACVTQEPQILMPSAFAPEGINSSIAPVILFDDPMEYEFLVFDRWGGMLFETNTPGVGWNGKSSGEDMPMGGYAYLIRITSSRGEEFEKRGIILLVR